MSIEGSITALVTPMNEKGDLDYKSLENLINFQIDSGISGLVAVGTTGESATIDFEDGEQVEWLGLDEDGGALLKLDGEPMSIMPHELETVCGSPVLP